MLVDIRITVSLYGEKYRPLTYAKFGSREIKNLNIRDKFINRRKCELKSLSPRGRERLFKQNLKSTNDKSKKSGWIWL